MTFACTDCSRCGKCYDKHSTCPNCGEPITDAMRDAAKQKYLAKKRIEHQKIVELAQQAKKRREQQERPKPVYPWEQGE